VRRYALTIAYDGTDFNGWQKQAAESVDEAAAELRSVQHVVERAVIETVREPIELLGASRTDSGVHAMAQMGSFVPARSAHIGLIDKVFTRIGASDDLTRGQSTFMVEMTETANILNNVTPKSLVILDEIGRGTSTYDGISIAWSVAEYLLINENRRAKTLFATHFWELTKLEEKKIGAKNYTIAVHESMGEITFLRKIIEGGTDKSYGIHVAKLAGLPKAVIDRAHEILTHLEETSNRNRIFEPGKPKKAKPAESQLNLF